MCLYSEKSKQKSIHRRGLQHLVTELKHVLWATQDMQRTTNLSDPEHRLQNAWISAFQSEVVQF